MGIDRAIAIYIKDINIRTFPGTLICTAYSSLHHERNEVCTRRVCQYLSSDSYLYGIFPPHPYVPTSHEKRGIAQDAYVRFFPRIQICTRYSRRFHISIHFGLNEGCVIKCSVLLIMVFMIHNFQQCD